jgi:hypothetical protein
VLQVPWRNLSYDDTVRIYSDLMSEVYGKMDFDLIVKELLVRAEMFKYDFTKRQMIIIMFIITFSYNIGQELAYIPRLNDFYIAGISPTKVKSELEKLVKMGVINWDQKENIFQIKDPREWIGVSLNVGYSDSRAIDLYFKNLDRAGIDVVKMIEKLNK